MRIAIQEGLLTGATPTQKFEQARTLGIQAVEVDSHDLTARVPALAEAMMATGIAVAAVNMGRQDGTIAPQPATREAAINALRQAMADAVDLNAAHVVFVPRFGRSPMPDLTPWRAPVELDGEMTVWLLRGMSDLAYAIGVELDIMPVNADETDFINEIAQAVKLRRKIRDHAHVKIAASLHHMRQTETDWRQALRDHLAHIGYLQLPVPSRSDEDVRDCAALASILADYPGWVTLTGDDPECDDVAAGVALLRQASADSG